MSNFTFDDRPPISTNAIYAVTRPKTVSDLADAPLSHTHRREQHQTHGQSKRKRFTASPSLPPSVRNHFQLEWTPDIEYAPRITPAPHLPLPPPQPVATTSSAITFTPAPPPPSTSTRPPPPPTFFFHQPYSLYDPRRQRIPSPLPAPSSHNSSPRSTLLALPHITSEPRPRAGGAGGKKKGGKGGRRSAKEKERDALSMPPPPLPAQQWIQVHPPAAAYLAPPATTPSTPAKKTRSPRAKNHQPHAPSPLSKMDDGQRESEEQLVIHAPLPPPARRSRKRKIDDGEVGVGGGGEENATLLPDEGLPKPKRRRARNTVPKTDSATTPKRRRTKAAATVLEEVSELNDSPMPLHLEEPVHENDLPLPLEDEAIFAPPPIQDGRLFEEGHKTPEDGEHSPSSPISFPVTPPSPSIRPTIVFEPENGLPFNTGLMRIGISKRSSEQNMIISVPYDVPIIATA